MVTIFCRSKDFEGSRINVDSLRRQKKRLGGEPGNDMYFGLFSEQLRSRLCAFAFELEIGENMAPNFENGGEIVIVIIAVI